MKAADKCFIISHYAGEVTYDITGFVEKNNDALTFDMHQMVQTSKDPFTAELFRPKEGEAVPKKGKITLISLGRKFIGALNDLMMKLNSTRASFVRCIKPNQKMKPKIFEGAGILSQLQCAIATKHSREGSLLYVRLQWTAEQPDGWNVEAAQALPLGASSACCHQRALMLPSFFFSC